MRSASRVWSLLRQQPSSQADAISNLPNELLLACLSLLRALDIVKYRRVCRRWRDIIDLDACLQLKIELWTNDLLDGPYNNIDVEHRAILLHEYKARWKNAQFLCDLDYRPGPGGVNGRMQCSIDGSVSYTRPLRNPFHLVICSPPSALRSLEKRMWALSLDDIDGTGRMVATDVAQDLLLVAETPPNRQW
ncbi:hypothetical protein GY45DRAFT_1154493 [Cubamyces sp. BRFM 1775]|nr:hypothetical protein GY45DRAFT_1154493 [Cubamyces sp. BRFM 1775]